MKPLNLFYEEPNPDRWLPFDRFPRRFVRRLVRGPAPIGGQKLVFVNLCKGLDLLGIPYRVNDYKYARTHPHEAVGIIGRPFVLEEIKWRNPILFGAALFAHSIDDPDLLTRLPVKKVLVPGEWMRKMCEPHYGERVVSWPVGIDTAEWSPATGLPATERQDFLLYDKIRWEHDRYEVSLIGPIRESLKTHGLPVAELRYGYYKEHDFRALLDRCRAMVFLCEHETQGIAYQQALACGVPILALDDEGFWRDPNFYPHRVAFRPVSSVPYWDARCGVKFRGLEEFAARLDEFLEKLDRGFFAPRDYILDNLTLEKCARSYVEHYRQAEAETFPPIKMIDVPIKF
jgi:hypothetical protein